DPVASTVGQILLLPRARRITPARDAMRRTVGHLVNLRNALVAAPHPDIEAATLYELTDRQRPPVLVEHHARPMHLPVYPLRAPNQVSGLAILALEPMRSTVAIVGQRPVDLSVGSPHELHDHATAHANGAPRAVLVAVGDLDDRMRRSC